MDISEPTDSTDRSSGLHAQGRTLDAEQNFEEDEWRRRRCRQPTTSSSPPASGSETGEWDEVKSPYDGSVVGRVAQGDEALAERAIEAAHEAFETADSPSTSAPRCSTAPPSWSASATRTWR